MLFWNVFLTASGTNDKVLMEGVPGCPMWEAVMAWTVLVVPVPLADTALTPRQEAFGVAHGGYFGCWQDPANAAKKEPL